MQQREQGVQNGDDLGERPLFSSDRDSEGEGSVIKPWTGDIEEQCQE